MTSISLSISHAPWRDERVASYERLRAQLDPWADGLRVTTDRAPNHAWSETMWRSAVEMGADWACFLQDDAIVAPDFRGWLDAMISASIGEVIGLEAVHPAAPLLAQSGHRWYTTRDGLVGVGYLLPTSALETFLEWRRAALKHEALDRLTAQGTGEDTLLGLWCLVTGRRIWHPLPTPIDHDVSLPSTYGNDSHHARRPLVRWDTSPEIDGTRTSTWEHAAPVHLGIFPGWRLPALALREVEGYTVERAKADLADDGRAALAPLLPRSGLCWSCLQRPKAAETHVTGAALCRTCVAEVVSAMIGVDR